METERWRQISRLCHAALLRAAPDRVTFVRDACAGDETLRREVESLLAEVSEAVGFLRTPAVAMAGSALSDTQSTMLSAPDGPYGAPNDASRLAPGQPFGPYRIERLLGRGGMGEVYEAEQLEYGRRIALKVLSQRLSDPTDRARFMREGRLAASVSHPHIVYIYSSEEIAGMPVIAMELLSGGTLKERVEKNGPLAPIEAIDAVLQVVSGLEAAHAAGILHRDIKPSNCFVDADGTVKIGDFGLSIPTLPRDATQLTVTGTVHGTPQFASPEQLRGQSLDMRSDIYAVGGTLYYLLTGRPPFDDRDLMVLVSRILTEPPPSPREARPGISRALTALVLQCLAKDPAHRPASYRALASALEPLSSTVRTPAPLGLRFAAGFIDNFFSEFLTISPTLVLLARPSLAFLFESRPVWEIWINLSGVAYFAITESVWGASLGKALCGFRVVTENGARPRFARALLRALVFVVPAWGLSHLALLISGVAYTQRLAGWITIVAGSIVWALLFAPARRANGFAGIHEWVSHTRTVLKSPGEVRRIVRPASTPIELPAGPQRVGPYVLVDAFGAQPNGGAALGYDDRLRRTVWLRFPAVDSESVPVVRRVVRRAARPRWLAGQRTPGLAWDAYEQVPGQPFDTLLTQVQSWRTVRGWLCDLAEEMHAGLRDGSLSVIEFDRVWIGDDGRARLLDWSVSNDRPDSAGSAPPKQTVDLPQAERFLYRVAVSALEGHVVADTPPDVRTPRVPLPISATVCLAKLGKQCFGSSEEMLTALTSAARDPAAISRAKRAAHLWLCAIPTIVIFGWGLFLVSQWFGVPRKDSNIAELAACLDRLEVMENRGVPSTNRQYRALEVYIAGRHRDLISNPPIWSASHFAQRVISSQQRALAKRVAANLRFPQKADVDEAARILRPFLDNVRSDFLFAHPYVRSVNDGGAADRAGVKANDVVVSVDGQPMTAAQLVAAIRSRPDQLITLSILRDGQPLMIRATIARRANQGLLGIVTGIEDGPELTPKAAWRFLWLQAFVGLMLAGTLGLFSALAVGGGIALRLMSIAVVTKNGTPASGSRARVRAVLSWLPVLAVATAAFAGHAPLLTLTPQAAPFFALTPHLPYIFPVNLPPIFFPNEPSILFVRVALIAVALVMFAVGVISAVIRPERSLQDRLAGTSLVPR